MDSPAAMVVAVMVSCSVPSPPMRVAVTVREYSVPSSRPVSVYNVSHTSNVRDGTGVSETDHVSVGEGDCEGKTVFQIQRGQ